MCTVLKAAVGMFHQASDGVVSTKYDFFPGDFEAGADTTDSRTDADCAVVEEC